MGGDEGSNGNDEADRDEQQSIGPGGPHLPVLLEALLHPRERVEAWDAGVPTTVVPDGVPGFSPRRDQLKHAVTDAREAED